MSPTEFASRFRAQAARHLAHALLLGAAVVVAPAQAPSSSAVDERAGGLQAAARTLTTSPALAGARVGVRVVDVADGRVIVDVDGDKGFMTASNMKLMSSAVALCTLGPDYRFATRLETQAAVEDGVLRGDLILIGSGDPTLGGRQESDPMAPFAAMAQAVLAAGIRTVEGRVVGDDAAHADEVMGQGWQWDYQSAAYAAQISGLCFAENVVTLQVEGTAAGKPPRIQVRPDVGYVLLVPSLVCGAPGTETKLEGERRRASNSIELTGRIAADGKAEVLVSVENPTRYAATALKRALADAGVAVRGPAIDSDDIAALQPPQGERRQLALHRSPPLGEIVQTLNKVSQNLYAEQFLRAAGRTVSGAGDLRGGAAAVAAMLEGFGVPTAGLGIEDGSGLTRRNLVQPRHFTGLLHGMWGHAQRAVFLESLPVAGVDGTLRSRYPDGPAKGRVRAKTGFISRVVALSGYVPRPEGGEPLVFSILVNNFTCSTADAKAAVDGFVQELARHAGWQ